MIKKLDLTAAATGRNFAFQVDRSSLICPGIIAFVGKGGEKEMKWTGWTPLCIVANLLHFTRRIVDFPNSTPINYIQALICTVMLS